MLEIEIVDAKQRIEAERNKPGTEYVAMQPPDAPSDRVVAITEVLQKDRSFCVSEGAWYEWVEGFSPQWHYEDWRMMKVEELRQAQTKMIADAEERGRMGVLEVVQAHKEVTEKLAGIATDQVSVSDRQEKSNRRFNRLFVAIGLLALVLAVAPLAYPNGIGWLEDVFPGGRAGSDVPPAQPPSDGTASIATPSPGPAPGEVSFPLQSIP
jgi:hypothetical protein